MFVLSLLFFDFLFLNRGLYFFTRDSRFINRFNMVSRNFISNIVEGWIFWRLDWYHHSFCFLLEISFFPAGITRMSSFRRSSKIFLVLSFWQYIIALILQLCFLSVLIRFGTVSAFLLLSRCLVIVLFSTSCQRIISFLFLSDPFSRRKSRFRTLWIDLGLRISPFVAKLIRDNTLFNLFEATSVEALRALAPIIYTINNLHPRS